MIKKVTQRKRKTSSKGQLLEHPNLTLGPKWPRRSITRAGMEDGENGGNRFEELQEAEGELSTELAMALNNLGPIEDLSLIHI